MKVCKIMLKCLCVLYMNNIECDICCIAFMLVDSMNEATKHLLGNLTEREKYEAERKVYEELQDTHHDQKHLKERVMKLSENAIKGQ